MKYKKIIPKEENKYMLKGGSNAVFPSSTVITFYTKQETLQEAFKAGGKTPRVDGMQEEQEP